MAEMNQIPSPVQILIERLQGKESLEVEFKSAQGGLPRSIWDTVSAFANTRGGWLVLGIAEKGDDLIIEGIKNAHDMLQSFVDTLHNPTKISYQACDVEDAFIDDVGDKEIIIIRVPAAPRKARPIYINQNPYQGTFVRHHTGDYHCSKPAVDRMMREAADVGADSTILLQYDWSDIDIDALARYRRRYQTLQPGSPWNSLTDQEFFKAIRGIRRDREKNVEGITVAGLLLIGNPDAIRDWRTCHLIDYRMLSDTSSETRWDDRILWEGHLFGAFEAIYPRLIQDQAIPFRLEGGVRIDEGFVQVALREAFINLLVHTDYAEPHPSLLLRSSEGYLFRNPGSSRVPDIDLLMGDRSDPRNPELVRMFRYIGLAEEAGTGIPKIVQSWRKLGFKMPRIITDTERYEFNLELRHAHLLAEEDRIWLHSLGGEWSEIEQLALVRAKHEGSIDNLSLRQMSGQHPADVTRVLGRLRDRGFLQITGVGRGARYQLDPRIIKDEGNPKSSDRNPTDLAIEPTDSEENPTDSPPKPYDFDVELERLWPELWDLSQAARRQHYLPAESLDKILIQLCTKKALSARELAKLLGRQPNHITQTLTRLISEGQLFRLYEQPSHPNQRYMSTSIG